MLRMLAHPPLFKQLIKKYQYKMTACDILTHFVILLLLSRITERH